MSHFPFRFGSYARLSLFAFALSLLALVAVEHSAPTAEPTTVRSQESQLRGEASQLLSSLLGEDAFDLHLSVKTEQVSQEVKELTPTSALLESEQIKREGSKKKAKAQGYQSEVSSRHWLVGQRVRKKKVAHTRVTRIRCVVLVDEAENLGKAEEALACLLGVDSERGDQLLFIRR